MIFDTKQIEAAIFDMDGTMFDTERLRMRMIQQASKEIYGETISEEILIKSLGLSAKAAEDVAKEAHKDFPYAQVRKLADELEVNWTKQNGVPVKDGLFNVLERLKKNDVLIALATSSRREIAEQYLLNAGVMHFFDITVCGDEIKRGKPNPDIFLKAASELNCDPSKCLVFEDSKNGLLSALGAGTLPIYIKDIKDPDDELLEKVFKRYESMKDFVLDLSLYTPVMKPPLINEHFPQSTDAFKAGIHGFGAIGGGYLSQIFLHWDGYTRPERITGATSNTLLKDLINAFGKYTIKYESIAYHQVIRGIDIISLNDRDAMNKMYIESDIIGLSLPEIAIKTESKSVAFGLLARHRAQKKSITLLIVMNKLGASKYFKRHLLKALKTITDDEEAQTIIKNTYFCETVVNRMVSKISPTNVLKQLHLNNSEIRNTISDSLTNINELENYFFNNLKKGKKQKENEIESSLHLMTDKISNFMFQVSKLNNLNIDLFSSEPDILIYADDNSPLMKILRQVKTVANIDVMQNIKNKLSNGTHAIIAWYSSLLGYKTIGQGIGDRRVYLLAKRIMENEIRPFLVNETPELKNYILGFIGNFIKRCRLSFKDSCHRVGRDPLRKLQKDERVLGNIQAAQSLGLSTENLELGVACAILYSLTTALEKDKEAMRIKELYQKRNSVSDVLCYDGDYNGSAYKGLNIETDFELILRIQNKLEKLQVSLEIEED
jgi:HAD superfamily hydrolase (TIGR01509 family)